MKFPDEVLMAYADGDLDLVARAEVEAAMAADPEVARAVERHRALRAQVQAAYRDVLDEPVPGRLAGLVAPARAAPVVDLAARRAAKEAVREAARPRGLPRWTALAASVVLGVLVGLLVARAPEAPIAESGGQLLAQADLARALDESLAGDGQTGAVRIGLTFRDRAGGYCRTFTMQQEAALAGLACRADSEWRLRVLAEAEAAAGELRTAAAVPAAVLQAVDATMSGDPLDAAAEAAARDAGWIADGTPPARPGAE